MGFADRMRRTGVSPNRIVAFFALAFAISWSAAFAVAAPRLLRHDQMTQLIGILMFPAMLLGPSLSGLTFTASTAGRAGLRDLWTRMTRWRFSARWHAPLLLPPVLILSILLALKTWVSPAYTANFFLLGVLFGVPAGFLEEIGWTGFAFETMRARGNAVAAAVLLGLLWVMWHIPVINYLGTVTPHGSHWLPFFAVFGLAMTAMRVLICWMYVNTRSVLLAQLMHVISTGSLVIFSLPHVNSRQEVLWYGLYGVALWIVVSVVYAVFGRQLCRRAAS